MRTITLGIITLLGVCLAPTTAAAQGRFVRLDLGLGLAKSVLESSGATMSLGADGTTRQHPGPESATSGPGFHAGAAVGYDWGRARLEGEYFRRSTARASGVHATFANVLYELPFSSAFKPFLGAGVGVQWSGVGIADHSSPSLPEVMGKPEAAADFDPVAGSGEDGTSAVAGYQLLAGMERALSESISLGARVRWAQFRQNAAPESPGWGMTLALRYRF